MFGLSQKEKFDNELSNLVGLTIGLVRELRSLLAARHPELELFIDSQPRSINAIYFLAAAITKFSWLMHSKGKLPMDALMHEFHLSVMKEMMVARNYDQPPQIAHREYLAGFEYRWSEYKDTLNKILLDKRVEYIDILYVQFDEDVFDGGMPDGSFTRTEASQRVLSFVMHALAFSKKNLS